MRRVKIGKIVLLVLMMGFSHFLFAQDLKNDPEYKSLLSTIESQLKTGDVESALKSIDVAIEKFPKGGDLYYAKSLLYAQARNYDVAISAGKSGVEADPENPLFQNHLLGLYKTKGDFDSAIGLINQVLSKNSANPQIYREKIMLLHMAKKSDEALKEYDLAKNKFGESDTLDVLKAEILMDEKKGKEAYTLLENWRKKKSPIRQVYSTMSYVLMDDGKAKEAIPILEEGILNSKDDLLYLDLVDVYLETGKTNLAYESLKKAFKSATLNFMDKHRVMQNLVSKESDFSNDQLQELANILVLNHPRMPDTHMFKGDVLWKKGELNEAKALYSTTVSMYPQHVEAWRKLLNVEMGMNELDNAIRDGNEALKHNPGNPIITYFIGLSHMMKKENDQARNYLEASLNNSVNENKYMQSMIYASLGDLYHEIKMEKASDVSYEEAINLDSTNTSAMNNYAYYLSLRKQDLDKAAFHAKRANELEENSGTFQDTYAWVLFQQGKYNDALVWIEKALNNSSKSAVLLEHYGDILFHTGKSKDALKQWEKALSISDNSSVNQEKLKKKISEKKFIE